MKARLLHFIGFAMVLLLWQVAHLSGLFSPTLLPSPYAAIRRLAVIIFTGDILPDMGVTLLRMIVGFGLAAILGIAFGLVIGSSEWAYRAFIPLVDFARSTPVTAAYPIFVLFAGVNHASKSLMVFAAALPIIVLNTSYGVRLVSPIRTQMARLFGATPLKLFWHIKLWEAAPHIWIGLRTSFSLAVVVEIVAEMFAGTRLGIGQRIFEAFNTYRTDELYAVILLTGMIGYGLNLLFELPQQRLLHWSSR